MAALDPRSSIVRVESGLMALADEVEALKHEQWASPSNCAGWKVADVAAHVTRNGESVLLAIQRALIGDTTPSFGPTMQAREDEMRASGPAGCAEILRREYRETAAIVRSLSDDQFELTFPHPMGMRSVAWYCRARLNEVTYHRWDIQRSLGANAPLDDQLATYSLEYMLGNTPPALFARSSLERPHRFCLVDGASSWTVTAGDVPQGESVDETTVTARAGWLALATSGRMRIDRPEYEVVGPEGAADLFATVFGQPTTVVR